MRRVDSFLSRLAGLTLITFSDYMTKIQPGTVPGQYRVDKTKARNFQKWRMRSVNKTEWKCFWSWYLQILWYLLDYYFKCMVSSPCTCFIESNWFKMFQLTWLYDAANWSLNWNIAEETSEKNDLLDIRKEELNNGG